MDSTPSPGEFLVLGTLEVLLNQALSMHPQGSASLGQLHGKVVRIRAYDPDYIFYCLIDRDGIELATTYDGDADIRVRGSAGALVYRALLPPGRADDTPADIQVDGEPEAVRTLIDALDTFNLWEAVRTWLREHVAMPEIFGVLRRYDPAWLERLQGLPELVGETLEELRRQAQVQQHILNEVRAMKESLRAERRTDILVITVATALLALALMTATGRLPVFAIPSVHAHEQAWILVALGLALMLSRLIGRRYE
ncbi:MAG: hypothetical protein ACOY33_06560 [Pseudomonadota bacterium]